MLYNKKEDKFMRMKCGFIFVLAMCLSGCANLPIKAQATGYVFGETPLYLRGSFNGVNKWDSGYESNLFTYVTSKSYEFCLKNVTLTAGDEFKIGAADWSVFEYGYKDGDNDRITDFSKSYIDYASGNFRCNTTGVYDIYARYGHNSTDYRVAIVKSASSLLSLAADNNFTRDTQINIDDGSSFAELQNDNYFGTSLTLTRKTLFINNGLYMHNGSAGNVNSGYFTPSGTTEMWHYTLKDGYSNLNETDSGTYVVNRRKDSSSRTTNEWFINGMYFANHASDIDAVMDFDFDNENFYCGDKTAQVGSETLFHDFMYFTAPVYEPSSNLVEFTGVGLKDLKGGTVEYYLYAADCTFLAESAHTVFSSARLTDIGSTTIPVLANW